MHRAYTHACIPPPPPPHTHTHALILTYIYGCGRFQHSIQHVILYPHKYPPPPHKYQSYTHTSMCRPIQYEQHILYTIIQNYRNCRQCCKYARPTKKHKSVQKLAMYTGSTVSALLGHRQCSAPTICIQSFFCR